MKKAWSTTSAAFPRRAKLTHYEDDDLLPHYLLAAVLADEMNASILTIWKEVEERTNHPIGIYWRWMAQQVRNLPTVESL